MASMASLVNLGYAHVALAGDGYSVTTDYIADQRTSLSLDSTNGGNKDDDTDLVLKPAPKPQLKSGSPVKQISSINSTSINGSIVRTGSDRENINSNGEERNKVIESLAEVLEKAEKLENNKDNVSGKKPPGSVRDDQKNGKPVNSVANLNQKSRNSSNSVANTNQQSKTTRSVWRKGNPVTAVQKIVKEPLKQEPGTDGSKDQPEPTAPVRSIQPPQKVQPTLQARPSVAPTPPVVKKPVILKDVGSAAKSPASNQSELAAKPKERKPILIDKFASKKAAVDPLVTQSVIAPPKPAKSFPPGKFKEDFRKKSGQSGGIRRRMAKDAEVPDDDLDVSIPGAATARKGRKWTKASRRAARIRAAQDAAPVKVEILEVGEEGMLTEELAENLAISEGEILGSLYSRGIKPDGVQKLSKDMVKMICKDYDVEVIDAVAVRVEEMAKKKEIFDEDDLDKLEERPPVLTIMGHVDHGKTSLLDYIRKTKVAASEAGGITQGIGAYKVLVPSDGKSQTCVFLDTPGHEAFGAMRARGARVTDIAVVVVAADDGIQPQTTEAIAHAKAAGVPIVIAINKIDKDGANPDRVMQELSSAGLMPEEWGGDTPMVKISALKGEKCRHQLKANPQRDAKGTVIEAGLDKAKGPVATFIVQNGTLKQGDIVVCGEAFGKVRALFDDKGKRVEEAGPSIPVQVIGLNNVPSAGDVFEVVGSLDFAREKAESRAQALRLEHLSEKAGDGKVIFFPKACCLARKQLGQIYNCFNIILKVDLQGSIEAIRQALQVLPQANVTLKFLLHATGDVSTSDVDLAVASKAIIFGFNVRASGSVKKYADNKSVEIRLYRVIYELIDDVRSAMEGLLESVEEQVPIGVAEVRAVFSSGSGRVAGCMVTEGKVTKDCGIRVTRKGKVVYVGVLDSLRRVKEDVKEVGAGLECGIGSDEYDDWEAGDTIEAFNKVEKRRTLEEASASMTAAFEEAGIQF
ncbi:hypothetical protein Leryth_023008 [Lithospermum erythrorhizon]|nr:hypothetical protein Leryth_023008 [Lithospermum erythrorhizon]